MRAGLDYETFSSVNLPKFGLDNYAASPDFRVMLASVDTETWTRTFDFVFGVIRESGGAYKANVKEKFKQEVTGLDTIVAHNAGFERRASEWLYSDFPSKTIVDSAVAGRAMGVGSKLEVASRQITPNHKLEVGQALVMRFCVPNDIYPNGATRERIEELDDFENWMLFVEYCEMDARASRTIYETVEKFFAEVGHSDTLEHEEQFEWVTHVINQNGWPVDVELVKKMRQRSWANGIITQQQFGKDTGTHINFNSPMQLQKFCRERGVPVKSLDKYNLPVVLGRVTTLLENPKLQDRERQMLSEVKFVLEAKQEIGGSALSKLPKILDLVGNDGILRNQYTHVGAGQTFRTAAKGVQMQNIPKMGKPRDVETLYDFNELWTNTDMAGQFRQLFRSRHPEGKIIVGDFSAVESRGLAYLAGEEWKLDAYREGKDVYKVLVTKYLGIAYEDVTPELRPRGKYSELSCGYQASGKAVQSFMFKLGFDTTIENAIMNVQDWRGANPNIVDFWGTLDVALKDTVETGRGRTVSIANGLSVKFTPFEWKTVQDVHPGAVSLLIQILLPDGTPYVNRIVHGCYIVPRDNGRSSVCYYKPGEKLSEGLWKPDYMHPELKKRVKYSIYGGKLAGILTQSLCRELFFDSLLRLQKKLEGVPNAKIIGQFHDEIGVDWWPMEGGWTEEEVTTAMRVCMTQSVLGDFPLDADINSSHRYIK